MLKSIGLTDASYYAVASKIFCFNSTFLLNELITRKTRQFIMLNPVYDACVLRYDVITFLFQEISF